ncbi:ABC transporter ATP-binding protein [Frondihabitans sp. VKM Ac-2883]|jgi:ABC-2 type transport system ATP-binding protein|uniref:ABC transporter ATP-binding protein n=1 Tax=Frondihabitans sp. VKM Ac-2883 TaxID=2783823 RepID=UPI00188CDA7B|nr:ABC transporter ATP-binding protein [Frondihabitans sp. VKM Ac-2883]MBF4577214.1 ABC transporter ATP-binding protein [Frondihabitans sp. VKM Ac-2883]
MIEATSLTKTYGDKTAVDGISFTVEPGYVTGFLGPNGSGKSTTMRMIVGLDRPTSGRVTVNGKPYADHSAPLTEVGILLDAKAAHPARSARNHLRCIARTHGISNRRVDEVISMTGLDSVAGKRVGKFSLGMGQRVGIAGALLGDPQTVILDEPVNGLDPEGVQWVRSLCRSLAAEGRAVLLSSHLMDEMAKTADRVVVLGRGRVIANASMDDIIAGSGGETIRVRSTDLDRLSQALSPLGATLARTSADSAEVTGSTAEQIARIAAADGIVLFEITTVRASLEEAFFALTHDAVEYRTSNHADTENAR